MSREQHSESHDRPVVLFLCTANSARSQMAEALLRREAEDLFEIYSAGLKPLGIHRHTEQVMNEIGIDMSEHYSKSVREYLGKLEVDVAIIVCEKLETTCPHVWPGARTRLYWPFEDPAAFKGSEDECLDRFRDIRDQIHDEICLWLEQRRELGLLD